MKVAFVLGTTAGGTGRHVQMLAAGCAVRSIPCAVFGSRETQRDFGFGDGVEFGAVDIGDRPNVRDGLAVLRLRRLLGGSGADVVHAHGLRAGALATLALSLRPSSGPLPLVVTVHNAPPSAGVNGAIYQALELIVARSAAAVLCVSADLEERMRRAGARDVARALVPSLVSAGLGSAGLGSAGLGSAGLGSAGLGSAGLGSAGLGSAGPGSAELGRGAAAEAIRRELGAGGPGPAGPGRGEAARAAAAPGAAAPGEAAAGAPAEPRGRPLIVAAGRLAPQKGFATLIEAAARWQDLRPAPLLAIAGEGPLRAELTAAAAPLGPAVRFLGHRADVPALLAAADVFVLPSVWEGQPLILQEALRAGRPIVATRVGGIPGLTGEDGGLLIPPGDPAALAAAVRRVLTSASLARRMAGAALARARTLPSENDAVEAALAVYRRLTAAALTAGPGAGAAGPNLGTGGGRKNKPGS